MCTVLFCLFIRAKELSIPDLSINRSTLGPSWHLFQRLLVVWVVEFTNWIECKWPVESANNQNSIINRVTLIKVGCDCLSFSLSADNSYVLSHYKTELCKKPPRLCRQGYACPYYHNSKDRRRCPHKHKYRYIPKEWYRIIIKKELWSALDDKNHSGCQMICIWILIAWNI